MSIYLSVHNASDAWMHKFKRSCSPSLHRYVFMQNCSKNTFQFFHINTNVGLEKHINIQIFIIAYKRFLSLDPLSMNDHLWLCMRALTLNYIVLTSPQLTANKKAVWLKQKRSLALWFNVEKTLRVLNIVSLTHKYMRMERILLWVLWRGDRR